MTKEPKLTPGQAAIIGAFTGVVAGPFGDVQAYADRLLGYSTYTHEYGSQAFADRLKEAARPDFVAIAAPRTDGESWPV